MPDPLVWINGRRMDAGGPHISAFDRGYMRADGLFETLRAYDGVPACLQRHMARLRRGAEVIGIAVPAGVDQTIAEASEAAAAAGWRDAAVRLSISRGVGDLTMMPVAGAETTAVVSATPLTTQASAALYERGIALHVAAGTRNEQSVTAGLKTLAYTEAVIAFNAARAAGFDEALFLDTQGHVSEATTANVFVVIGGRLRTPPPGCGILVGITRAIVLELAAAHGISAAEEIVELAELEDADEVFITSSVRELMPVTRIGAHRITSGSPGLVYRKLHDLYGKAIRECA